MARTRLSRRLEKKSKKNFFFATIGIIVIIFLLLKFGIFLLANLSLYVSHIGRKENVTKSNQKSYIAPPILNPLPNATNSASIVISGNAFKDENISLFINDVKVDNQSTDEKGAFSFSENLDKGSNEIKTKAKIGSNESDFSDVFNIVFEDKAPQLTIDSPSDGQSFGKGDSKIPVTGTTNVSTSVTVNGFWAVIDENNHYSYTLNLKDGENQIIVVATDLAGNKSEKVVKVNYSQ
jgi:bacillopeptidase F